MTTLRARRHPLPVVLGVGPAIALLVFYVWPFLTLTFEAVDIGSIRSTFGRERTWRILWFTSWQAVVSTAATMLIGLAPAWVIARFDFPGRRLLVSVLTAIFVMPTVVMGAAFLALFPDSLDRTVWAVLAAHVVFNLAVVVRTVGAVWEHLPVDMDHAAATLGASPFAVFREITLPLIRPAITAAASVVFLFTFTSFGVIRILAAPGTRTIEVEVWRRATQLGEVGEAAVLALLQLGVLGLVAVWSTIAQRRHSRALDLRPLTTPMRPRHRRQQRTVAVIAATTAIVAVAPLLALIVKSVSSPSGWTLEAWRTLGSAEIRPGISLGLDPIDSIVNSIRSAAWATTFAVVIGALASLSIAASGRAGRFLDAGLMLPLGTSAVTIGFGMLITFDTVPVDWRASWWLVPVGHALVAAPFVVRTALGVLRSVDPDLSAAAATLGASPVVAWREIVVPHLWRPLAVAAALAAAISLGEFGATSFLSRSGGETLPIAIERLLGRTGSLLQAKGYALASLLAALTVAIVLVVDRTHDIATREAQVIAVDGVTVSFDGHVVLDNVSLSADHSTVIALLGRSGSGKSTLLRVIAGIVPPDAGRIHIDDRDVTNVPTHERRVGMVFQDNQLFPHRNVADNVGFGLKMAGITKPERRRRTTEWLDRVGLPGFERRHVTELSGGEAKRVALARTLITAPSVVLLDEPLTGLDRELHDDLVVDLARLLHDSDTTAILVTHDVDEATAIADRVVRLGELSGGSS